MESNIIEFRHISPVPIGSLCHFSSSHHCCWRRRRRRHISHIGTTVVASVCGADSFFFTTISETCWGAPRPRIPFSCRSTLLSWPIRKSLCDNPGETAGVAYTIVLAANQFSLLCLISDTIHTLCLRRFVHRGTPSVCSEFLATDFSETFEDLDPCRNTIIRLFSLTLEHMYIRHYQARDTLSAEFALQFALQILLKLSRKVHLHWCEVFACLLVHQGKLLTDSSEMRNLYCSHQNLDKLYTVVGETPWARL